MYICRYTACVTSQEHNRGKIHIPHVLQHIACVLQHKYRKTADGGLDFASTPSAPAPLVGDICGDIVGEETHFHPNSKKKRKKLVQAQAQ